jgi:hypothetical protein
VVITPWIDIIANHLKLGDCALSMIDSTTSKDCLCRTNFSKLGDDPIQATVCLEVARMHAKNYIALGFCDYSQWFPGKEKNVTNAFSRIDDHSDEELTLIFCSHCLSQILDHFKILPLPKKSSRG